MFPNLFEFAGEANQVQGFHSGILRFQQPSVFSAFSLIKSTGRRPIFIGGSSQAASHSQESACWGGWGYREIFAAPVFKCKSLIQGALGNRDFQKLALCEFRGQNSGQNFGLRVPNFLVRGSLGPKRRQIALTATDLAKVSGAAFWFQQQFSKNKPLH